MSADLTTREQFRRLADAALDASTADHTFVELTDRRGGTARFANNQIVQHVNTRKHVLDAGVAFGSKTGHSSTTDLSVRGVRDAVKRAEEIALLAPEDPEYLPPLAEQTFPHLETFRPETASAGPERLLRDAKTAIELCRRANFEAAGIVTAYASAHGLAADTGLFAFEPRTRAEFSLTATGESSSGWAKNAHRSIDALGVEERASEAVDKARRSAAPREVPAGRHTVILEPAAVVGLIGPLFWMLDAKAYDRGTSPVSGKLGKPVFDERLTLRNHPEHPRLLGRSFGDDGQPADAKLWVDRGILEQLHYDRFTAKKKGVEPSAPLDAPHLEGDAPAATSIEDLVRSTERGILVTNFWYIRFVNPTDLTLTGMTRDGTFLIRDGKVDTGLVNFRWHDSPLRAFNAVEAYTPPMDAITVEHRKMLLPALKIRDFNFSSVTRF